LAGSNDGCYYRRLREVAPVIKLWMWRLCCKWLSSRWKDYVGILVVEMLVRVFVTMQQYNRISMGAGVNFYLCSSLFMQ